MKWKVAMAISMAALAGIALGLIVSQSIVCRDAIGRLCGKGRLVAAAQSRGIYEADVNRAVAELQFNSGRDDWDANAGVGSRELITKKLVATAVAQDLAAGTAISQDEIERELKLMQSQFANRHRWKTALHASNLSERALRRMVVDNLRTRRWIASRIASRLQVTTEEYREFYDKHPEFFSQPVRIRANHLFLAAPPETPPEIVDFKKAKMDEFAKRIKLGENLSTLATVESEDDRTKAREGDLGYFSSSRMPEDFFAAAAKIRPGEISRPVKTVLGFHIIAVTDLKSTRQLALEEAREEIGHALEREKRHIALREMEVDLSARSRFIRPVF